jgi:hypothetical protein
MSGEILEDYFRYLNVDESRRIYLEDIKEGKLVDKEIEEHFKNGIGEQHLPIAEHRYSTYMKRFVIHRHQNKAVLSSYTWSHTS